MDDLEDEIIEVPVLRLNPLPGEETRTPLRRTKSAAGRFITTVAFGRSESLPLADSSSNTPDRLVFPGQERPKSAACLLRELRTPVYGRQKNSLRQTPESYEIRNLPDAPKKVNRDELETIVSRLQRQTNSGRARLALTRRINQKKMEPTKNVRVDYLAFEPFRFRGLRKVTKNEMNDIVSRLSHYEKDRKPAESERYHVSKRNHETLGVLNSYRWKGLRNC